MARSVTKSMTWLLRSAPISFRARRLRTAWAAGIICELGKRAAVTTACRSMRSSKGRNRKRPAKGVRKEQGDRSRRRTSATSAISGFTVTGRSSSARRGRREKPSSLSKTGRELMLMVRLAEEGNAFSRVVTELMTQDAEGARRIAEAAGDVGGRLLFEEVSTEGFVLALHGGLRGEEEVLVARCRYLICSAGFHISIVLPKHGIVNMFGEERGC